MPRLSDLPDIDFVDIDATTIQKSIFSLYTTITGRELAEGDPVRIFLLFVCDVIIRLLTKLNYTGKQNLLKYSEGDNLENIGALVGTTRIAAMAATTAMQITLSASRDQATVVPAGTRIGGSDNIVFATANEVIIPTGSTTAQVMAVCTETGTAGNNYAAGEISNIIDPVPYVASIVNISKTEGGSGVESDDSLRERIFESPESYSCAGPTGAYIYYAKSCNSAIIDASVLSPSAGVVRVAVLLTGGVLPKDTVLSDIEAKLSASDVRPLTDKVEVVAPTAKGYNLNVKYWLVTGADAASVATAVNAAVEEYRLWQRTKIGRDINPDELVYRLKAISGVKRVSVVSPAFTALGGTEVAQDESVTIGMAGSEDE